MESLIEHAPWDDEPAFLEAVDACADALPQLTSDAIQFDDKVPAIHTLRCADAGEAARAAAGLNLLTGQSGHHAVGSTVSSTAPVETCAAAIGYARFSGRAKPRPVSGGADWFANAFLDLCFELPGRSSVWHFFRRLMIGLAVTTVGVAGLLSFRDAPDLARWAVGVVAVIGAAIMVRVVWSKLRRLFAYHRQMGIGLTKLYREPRVSVMAPFPIEWLTGDPLPEKLKADLEDARAQHCFDLKSGAPDLDAHSRFFVLTCHHTFFILSHVRGGAQFQSFPARPNYLLITYFQNGTRLVSVSTGGGYRRRLEPDKVLCRTFAGADHVEILERHRAVVARLAAEEARVPILYDPATMIDRMNAEFEEVRGLYAREKAYTWGDALHEVFGVVRKEYLEPNAA
jgi:hypothetical protein